jgi:eukaryotic-like serine/threonine-protein kinase
MFSGAWRLPFRGRFGRPTRLTLEAGKELWYRSADCHALCSLGFTSSPDAPNAGAQGPSGEAPAPMSAFGRACLVCGGTHPAGMPCPDAVPAVGTVMDDKYELVRVLGEGGMGKVFEGRHRAIGRRVAVKFLLPESARNPDIVRRFENEARAAGRLEHENIAAVFDFGRTASGLPYLVMEYLVGEDCATLLQRSAPLSVAHAVGLLLQVCRGLDVAHRNGIVHRDLKPANLFVTKRADRTDLVKILDFGIAKLRSADAVGSTATGAAMGTVPYMSPEQARGQKDLDHRSDVYALGVILYELLSRRRPHEGESALQIIYRILTTRPVPLDSLRGGLPPAVVAVVHRALAFDPGDRFPSVVELAEALVPFSDRPVAPFRSEVHRAGIPVTAVAPASEFTPVGTSPPVSRTASAPGGSFALPGGGRGKRWAAGAAALVVMLSAGVAVLVAKRPPQGVVTAPPSGSSAAAWEPAGPQPRVPAGTLDPSTPPAFAPTAVAASAPAPMVPIAPVASIATSGESPSLRRPGAAARPTVARPGATPLGPQAPSAAVANDCDPNFYLDPQGEKHFKPYCFPSN